MSNQTRLLPGSGVAFNEDVNRLRAAVIMSQVRGGRGMLTTRGQAGTVSSPASGLRTAPYSSIQVNSTVLSGALSVAGVIPTNTEIATALTSVFTTASRVPVQGDMVNLTVSSVCKIRSIITLTGTASGLYVVAFTYSGVTYYGNNVQTGLY